MNMNPTSTDTTDMDEFRGKMQDLITEMKLLQKMIRRTISVDK